jgi:pre-mRNA-splicing factor ATP-dependent RNA helicase DHX16
VAAMSVAARVA